MVSTVFAAALFAGTGAFAQNGTPINSNSKNALTVAVYGDSPYGLNPTDTIQIDKTSAFIASINADPKVDLLDSKPVTHLVNYEPFIASIATHTRTFGKPVLLFNGDSHHYRSDNPLEQGQPCVFEAATGTGTVACSSINAAADFTPDAWNNHPRYKVPNFHRVVVHGSTEPLEWLRLTITPGATAPAGANAFGPFTWERIDPLP